MASSAKNNVRRIVALAVEIEADILHRNLKPGDRFLSTAETAKMLRVDMATANRALQLLVKRNVLRRRQRSGTFIAEPDEAAGPFVLNRLHILTNDSYPQVEGWFDTKTLFDIQGKLPGVQLQFHMVPAWDETRYVEQLIADSLRSQDRDGFVLTRSALTSQRLIAASGLPAIVFGHVYASVSGLPSVDRDQYRIGRLLSEYLLGQGHRRILVFMRQRLMPGDMRTIDGVRDVLDAAGLPASAFTLRCIPDDPQEVCHEVHRLFSQTNDWPGILARPAMMADAVIDAVKSFGLTPHEDVAIAADSSSCGENDEPPYPVIRPSLYHMVQGAHLSRVMVQLVRGEPFDPLAFLCPVELCVPKGLPSRRYSSKGTCPFLA